MFHSVGITSHPWVWSELSQEFEAFEEILTGLAERGFNTVSLEELHDHMSGASLLRDDSIVLTFDDGYLDNWVYIVPLLRKYNMRGTVYVTPEFVEDSNEIRPTIEDVWYGRISESDLMAIGFMNWTELQEIDRTGVLDVQCHALTHTWYFSGPRVIDFHRPEPVYRYPWLSWNTNVERKPFYLSENQQELVAWGHPVFENDKSLIVKKFFPDETLVMNITEFVERQGGAEFFRQDGWRGVIEAKFCETRPGNSFPGRFETDSQHYERVLNELALSRELLEDRLGKVVKFLCWPGGGINQELKELARQVGYVSWTQPSRQRRHRSNVPGADPTEVKRISGESIVHFRGRKLADGGSSWVLQRVLSHQGSIVAKTVTRLRKLGWLCQKLWHRV